MTQNDHTSDTWCCCSHVKLVLYNVKLKAFFFLFFFWRKEDFLFIWCHPQHLGRKACEPKFSAKSAPTREDKSRLYSLRRIEGDRFHRAVRWGAVVGRCSVGRCPSSAHEAIMCTFRKRESLHRLNSPNPWKKMLWGIQTSSAVRGVMF